MTRADPWADVGPPGQRLLPTLVDEHARSSPEDTFVAIPRSVDLKEGYRNISYGNFSTAVNQCAWWLEHSLGVGQGHDTLGYIGPSDLLYPIIAFAAVKTGYKALFNSPRNTLEAHLSLIDETQCLIFLVPEKVPPIVRQILRKKEMKVVQIPSLDFFLQSADVAPYPFKKSFDEARYMPFLALHTSGSTGLPKSVILNHGTFCAMDAYNLIPSLGGQEVIGPSLKGSKMLVGFPLTHTAAYTLLVGLAVYYGVVGVLPPANQPLTANIADQVHRLAGIQGTALPSTTLIDIYNDPRQLRQLQELQYVFFAGSTLPKNVGDTIAAATNLSTIIGSTEMGYLPIEITNRSDWDYVSYSPFYGNDFRPVGADGLYEHCVIRNKDLELFQSIFYTYPNLSEFCTKDLYEKHPIKDKLWRYRGRRDDLIVFTSGEKLNPIDMEGIISVHPAIVSALVGGEGKFHSFLLVEPADFPSSQESKLALLDDIWPTVQHANDGCPSFGRIMKDCIIFTRPGKPVFRAAKGTVQRKATLQRYQEEIDIICDSPDLPKDLPHGLECGPDDLHVFLHRIITSAIPLKEDLTDDADLFELGLESLQVIALSKQINAYLKRYMPDTQHVTAEIIYAHSTLSKLEKTLVDLGRSTAPGVDAHKMQDVFEDLLETLPVANSDKHVPPSRKLVVLLTGSTGSLGSYLLSFLSLNPAVEMVYCLNRGDDAQVRQTKSFAQKGLAWKSERITHLQCSLSDPNLGLEQKVYGSLAQSVTHVIHNAWDLNFIRSLDSYANSHLQGLRYLIDFASQAPRLARLAFISTIATATAWADSHEDPVPETVMDDWHTAEDMGYAQSKSIAERLLAAASDKSGLQTAIYRLGQIAGPTTESGVWNPREWIPSLIASSVHMGKLPASLGSRDVVDWIPVDVAARVILELVWASEKQSAADPVPTTPTTGNASQPPASNPSHHHPQVSQQQQPAEQSSPPPPNPNAPPPTPVYNIVNPSPTTWPSLTPIIQRACTATHLEIVPFNQWMLLLQSSSLEPPPPRLQKRADDGEDMMAVVVEEEKMNPALKLVGFLEGVMEREGGEGAGLSTEETVKASGTLRALGPVGEVWMGNWMRQWGYS